LRSSGTSTHRRTLPISLRASVWQALRHTPVRRLRKIHMEGTVDVIPRDLVPVLHRHRSTLEEIELGPFETSNAEDVRLPRVEVFRKAAACPELHTFGFELNSTGFKWANKLQTADCLKRLLGGGTIEEEARIRQASRPRC